MFRIFSIVIFCQTYYSRFYQPHQNSSQDLVTLQLTRDQAEKVYDALSTDVNNRMLSNMGPSLTSNMNRRTRRKNRKSNVLTEFYFYFILGKM